MVEKYNWGVISTISTHEGLEGTPFGNPISIAEVCGSKARVTNFVYNLTV